MNARNVLTVRLLLGWSREHLARSSNVPVSSVYILERLGHTASVDDKRIIDTLVAANTCWRTAALLALQSVDVLTDGRPWSSSSSSVARAPALASSKSPGRRCITRIPGTPTPAP